MQSSSAGSLLRTFWRSVRRVTVLREHLYEFLTERGVDMPQTGVSYRVLGC